MKGLSISGALELLQGGRTSTVTTWVVGEGRTEAPKRGAADERCPWDTGAQIEGRKYWGGSPQ